MHWPRYRYKPKAYGIGTVYTYVVMFQLMLHETGSGYTFVHLFRHHGLDREFSLKPLDL